MPALRRGSIEFVRADDKAHFLAFQRADRERTLLVGFNRGDADYPGRFRSRRANRSRKSSPPPATSDEVPDRATGGRGRRHRAGLRRRGARTEPQGVSDEHGVHASLAAFAAACFAHADSVRRLRISATSAA